MHPLTRRRFLAAAAGALAAPLFLTASVLGRGGRVPPSGKITVGMIGVGGRGHDHTRALLARDDVQIVAACDVFRAKAEDVARLAEGQ
ncbi:MAG: gfo/Idh/MocA family oxidoreductase, partial [Acidobacteria bacterium]|nr:gfo/Idh/MocA family oxidoreductase [Acidobacteriota bacterium]